MQTAATVHQTLRTFLLVAQFDPEAIGARIQQARNEAGLTQEELADLAEGFSKRSLQNYETGETIPFKHLREIGTLLNRDTAWFLYGDPAPEPVPVGDRLAELADVVATLTDEIRTMAEGAAGRYDELDRRLDGIEQRLPPPSRQRRPTVGGSTAEGGLA